MKFALFLAGCGQHDGSEIQEVIVTLLSLAQEHITWQAFAPHMDQTKVVDHLKGVEDDQAQRRNVLKESARLVRGNVLPLSEFDANAYDAFIIPGGFGVVNHLCHWQSQQPLSELSFQREMKRSLDEIIALRKPLGFICIAPIMIPKLWVGAKLTIGHDQALAKQINQLGCIHVDCRATEIVIDKKHHLVSTPANMVAKNIDEVYTGVHKLVKALVTLVKGLD